MADEGRLEGVPSRRRAGGARARARHEGESLGLQRPVAGTDDRVRGGRQAPHLRHQPSAGAHHDPLARRPAAIGHGRGGRPDAEADPGRQDLRVRVRDEEVRHVHVPPARRRDGADGDGDDGVHRRAPARSAVHARRPRLRVPDQRLRRRSRRLHAEGEHDARLQSVELEQPRLPGNRSPRRPQGRPRARPDGQPDDDQPSDSHARCRVQRHLHRRRLGRGPRRNGPR